MPADDQDTLEERLQTYERMLGDVPGPPGTAKRLAAELSILAGRVVTEYLREAYPCLRELPGCDSGLGRLSSPFCEILEIDAPT
jgi:hypothetical protein